jgi:RNA polymerase sigma-70 factor, ECF subfamily
MERGPRRPHFFSRARSICRVAAGPTTLAQNWCGRSTGWMVSFVSQSLGKPTHSLVARASAGDHPAWRELYAAHAPVVRRLCLGFGSLTADEIEDCVQETFVRAFQSLHSLRNEESLRPWLLSIARSRCLQRLGGRAVEQKALDRFSHDPAVGGASPRFDPELATRDARALMVREMIESLPTGPERETIELFYLKGELSARQIADQMGVGKSAITMRLERFRARAKRRLAAGLARLEGKST